MSDPSHEIRETKYKIRAESEQLEESFRALQQRPENTELVGLDTGFEQLNQLLCGLQVGLYVFAGPPSCGKTTFLKQLADHVAEFNDASVLYFAYEQSAHELRIKSLARLSQVSMTEISLGRTEAEMESYPGGPAVKVWERIERAAETYRRFAGRLQVFEAGADLTVQRIYELARSVREKTPTKQMLIIIDPLQAIETSRQSENEQTRCSVCSELRRLGRDLDCPVVAAATQPRHSYLDNRKPTLEAFHEDWGVERSADVAGAFWTNRDVTKGHSRAVSLYILKNRHGGLGKTTLMYQPNIAGFMEQGKQPMAYLDSFKSQTDS